MTGEDGVDIRWIVALAADLIVVGELLTRGDAADRIDEDPRVLDHGLAVWLTGVIDEARLVAVDSGVDHGGIVGDEKERVTVVRLLVLVAPVGLLVGDALTEVFDDARAARDALSREYAESVERGSPHLDERLRGRVRGAHTATGARIGAWC